MKNRLVQTPAGRALMACAVVALVVGVTAVLRSAPEASRIHQGQSLAQPVPLGVAVVDRAPVPLTPQFTTTIGETVFLFGLRDGHSAALIYSPSDGTWLDVAAPPFEVPLRGAAGVPSADAQTVAVLGTLCAIDSPVDENDGLMCNPGTLGGAIYDVATDSWTRHDPGLSVPPRSVQAIGAIGDLAVFQPRPRGLLAFDSSTSGWVELASPSHDKVCAVDGQLIAAGPIRGQNHSDGEGTSPALFSTSGLNASVLDGRGWVELGSIKFGDEALQFNFYCSPSGIYATTAYSLRSIYFLSAAASAWSDIPPPPPELVQVPTPEGVRSAPSFKDPFGFLNEGSWTGRGIVLSSSERLLEAPPSENFAGGVTKFPAYAAALDTEGAWTSAEPGPVDASTTAWADGFAWVANAAEDGALVLSTYRPT